jgi:anti-sigma regulatory factor (Ser/Thr protein kinase)
VFFYQSDEELVREVGRYIGAAVLAGEAVVALATESHLRAFEAEVQGAGADLHQARKDGYWTGLDASSILAQLIVGGLPDRESFERVVIGGVLEPLLRGGRPVWVYGEMVTLLWDAGQVPGAIELEDLWNESRRDIAFSLLCAYGMGPVVSPDLATSVERVCAAHSAVVGPPPGPRATASPESARTFAGAAFAAREARRFVAEALLEWDCPELAGDAELVVTELAANAVLHARSSFTVTVTALPQAVRISVRDASRVLPRRRRAAERGLSGRGLRLVGDISRHWGTEQLPDGKVVWAELALAREGGGP